jgi:hypothetical protein
MIKPKTPKINLKTQSINISNTLSIFQALVRLVWLIRLDRLVRLARLVSLVRLVR